jgi:hypothetical protein
MIRLQEVVAWVKRLLEIWESGGADLEVKIGSGRSEPASVCRGASRNPLRSSPLLTASRPGSGRKSRSMEKGTAVCSPPPSRSPAGSVLRYPSHVQLLSAGPSKFSRLALGR